MHVCLVAPDFGAEESAGASQSAERLQSPGAQDNAARKSEKLQSPGFHALARYFGKDVQLSRRITSCIEVKIQPPYSAGAAKEETCKPASRRKRGIWKLGEASSFPADLDSTSVSGSSFPHLRTKNKASDKLTHLFAHATAGIRYLSTLTRPGRSRPDGAAGCIGPEVESIFDHPSKAKHQSISAEIQEQELSKTASTPEKCLPEHSAIATETGHLAF